MKKHHRRRAAALTISAMIAAAAFVGIARADSTNPGIVTVTDQQSSFSSPGNLYGPWSLQTLEYQWQAGKNDVPSLTFLNRTDDDRPISSSSRALYGDDYHTWSNTFYTYAQVSFADGDIEPYNLAYLEGDLKLDPQRSLVLGAGGGVTRNPGDTSTRWVSIGPSFYTGSVVFEVRMMPANTNGITTSATEGIIQYNRLGQDQVTATVLSGSQPSVLVNFPPSYAVFQRLTEYDLVWRHWITPKFGIVAGGTVGTHDDRASGATLYDQRSFMLGVFYGRAVGQPR